VVRRFTSRGRLRRLVFEQRIDGASLINRPLTADVTSDGRLVDVLGAPEPDLPRAMPSATVGAASAGRRAAHTVGTDPAPPPRELVALADGDGAVRPAWQTIAGKNEVLVDARTGAILRVTPLTRSATALIFGNRPGAPIGGTQERVELGDYVLSDDQTTLYGPNALVFADEDNDETIDANERILPTADGDYEFPYVAFHGPTGCAAVEWCSWNPQTPFSWRTNRDEAAVQAFALASAFHDHLQNGAIDFTAAKGAFEGASRTWIQVATAAATDGGLPPPDQRNNASNYTPSSGSDLLTFLLFDDGSNSAEDAATVYHEYTHGLSNRLMGGQQNLVGAQADAMQEGWSDWYALDWLSGAGWMPDTAAPGEMTVGALGRSQGLDCPVGATAVACPGSPAAGPGGYTYGDLGGVIDQPEPHADGEIWAETLWDLRRRLIARYGTSPGIARAEVLVTAGLEMAPVAPSMLDMRNAMLEAENVYAANVDRDLVWQTFAARGMGYFAAAVDSRDVHPAQDFSMPPPPDGPVGDVHGTLTSDQGVPLPGVVVTVGGLRGYVFTTTDAEGRWSLNGLDIGTYPKIYSGMPGGLERAVAENIHVTAGAAVEVNLVARRDWASYAGGGRIASADGNDDGTAICGPSALIDQDSGTTWLTPAPAFAGAPGPKAIPLRLPPAVDMASIAIDPTQGCGTGPSAMLGQWRLEVSLDGQTFQPVASGAFTRQDAFRRHPVSLGAAQGGGVRYVRLVGISSLDPSKPSNTGARWLGITDLSVYGLRPSGDGGGGGGGGGGGDGGGDGGGGGSEPARPATVSSIALAGRVRNRRVGVRLRCRPATGADRCRGTLKLSQRSGSSTFAVRPGVRTVTVRLTARALAALRRRGRLRVTLTVVLRQSSGDRTTTAVRVTLRR
jgi:extracellular elastinolytic metalloproteinase